MSCNALLVHHARRGSAAVRLKGGDPFVFGRGGEEAEALAQAGIPFDVVPRGSRRRSRCRPTQASRSPIASSRPPPATTAPRTAPTPTGRGLPPPSTTLVVLMAARMLPRIARELVAHGRSADTPVAMIHSGTTEAQATITAALGDVADGIELAAPVVAVIGDVVALRERLSGSTRPPAFQAALTV